MKKVILCFFVFTVFCLLLVGCGKSMYDASKELIKEDIHDSIASMAIITYGSVTTAIDITSMEEDPNTTVSTDKDFDELKAYKIEGTYTLRTLNGQLVNSGYFNANYSAMKKGKDVAVIKNSLDY